MYLAITCNCRFFLIFFEFEVPVGWYLASFFVFSDHLGIRNDEFVYKIYYLFDYLRYIPTTLLAYEIIIMQMLYNADIYLPCEGYILRQNVGRENFTRFYVTIKMIVLSPKLWIPQSLLTPHGWIRFWDPPSLLKAQYMTKTFRIFF